MTAWRSSIPRDQCIPAGSAAAVAQAREILEPQWSEGNQRIPIEVWVFEIAQRFLAHRQLESTAPNRADTREALTELAKKTEGLLRQLQRLDPIALDAIEHEGRYWSAAAAHPLSKNEERRPYQVLLLGNPSKGADSAFASALKLLAFTARQATERVPEGKDGYRNSFTSRAGTAQGQLINRCAQMLQDLGLSVAGTVPKISGGDSGALLFQLTHSVMWFASGEEAAEYPKARYLRIAARLFDEIATIRQLLEQTTAPAEDLIGAMQDLGAKEASLAKL